MRCRCTRCAGLAAALVGGDVNTGADAGGNAAENNAFFIPAIIVIISAAYATGVGDGDPLEGLAVIGRGDDPLSQAMAAATTEIIELSARYYPDQTVAVLSVLQATKDTIDATITYVDEATNKEVSIRWNRLDQRTREQLIGGGKILSIALPAASVKLIKDLKVARNSGSGVADGVPSGVNTPNPGTVATVAGRPIQFDGQFYSADGFKFSASYYDRLWSSGGRPAPFLQARAIMDSNPTIMPDPRGAAGYFRYEGAGMEMIYNPTTGQVGHIQPLR